VGELGTDRGRGSGLYTLGIVAAAALGGFLFGFDTAVINGAVPVLKAMFASGPEAINEASIRGAFATLFPDGQGAGRFAGALGNETAGQVNFWVGLSVAMALAGAAVGAFAAGPIADRIGRKRCMVGAAVLFLASAIGSGIPVTILDFTFWRVVGGIAFGAASVLGPAYIAEVSPAHVRGRLGTMQQLAIVVGIFVALLSNFGIASVTGGAAEPWLAGVEAWRWMFWVEAIPAAAYGVFALLIPESPRYLVAQGRDEEAKRVLDRVLGEGAGQGKITEIHRSLSSEHKPRLSDILAKGRGFVFLPIVWLGIGLSVFQQFVGINVVFYYSNLLWQSVGLSEDKALLNTVIGGATNVLTTFIAIALVDKIGRKPLLIAGSAGMVVALGAMATTLGTAPLRVSPAEITVPGTDRDSISVRVELEWGDGTARSESLDIELEPGESRSEGKLDFDAIADHANQVTALRLTGLPEGASASRGVDLGGGVFDLGAGAEPDLRGASGVVALVALNLFIVAFGFSWGPIVWVMLGEMFSNQIRGAGLAVAAASQWGANFLITMTFPMMAGIGIGIAYGFYAFSALLSLVFVLALIPETKGRELEEMGELERGA